MQGARCLEHFPFINSVTDVHRDGSPGAPISRHYREADLRERLSAFDEVCPDIIGTRAELSSIPS
jgi:hypothetical protein